ncbi:CaiB/BaiF CoA transferase family protein [Chloroflexota bacterium]
MLSPYRVLDLTDEKGLLCGKILGDLGADVIKVERPGGDPARNIGPFYHDQPHPEKSLFWFAFNTSKRGITLNIKTTDGREIFMKLVKSADFVIESFTPGHMDKLELGYSDLEKVNPGIIMVSITPFGQTGPYKDYKAPDVVAWAMGGQMYSWGDDDRPPIRISHHSQAHLHAAGEAAVGAVLALYYREMTGKGQYVDISIQAAVAEAVYMSAASWDMTKTIQQRGRLMMRPGVNVTIRRIWPCKDGYVVRYIHSGEDSARLNKPLIDWMDSEGMANDFLKGFDWYNFDTSATTEEVMDNLQEPIARFFMSHTSAELLEGALKHHVVLFPMATTKDILENAQLAARGFWVELDHPELGDTITYPGAFAKSSEKPLRVLHRAPLVGEHNIEVYEKELNISSEKLLALKQTNVI